MTYPPLPQPSLHLHCPHQMVLSFYLSSYHNGSASCAQLCTANVPPTSTLTCSCPTGLFCTSHKSSQRIREYDCSRPTCQATTIKPSPMCTCSSFVCSSYTPSLFGTPWNVHTSLVPCQPTPIYYTTTINGF